MAFQRWRVSWRTLAACLDAPVELFFPQPGKEFRQELAQAREYCDRCPVKTQCLQYAMAFEAEHGERSLPGIWGGTSERERWKLRRTHVINR